MTTSLAALLATLGEAQQIASLAMEATAGDSGSDSQTLAELQSYVAGFARQVDAVLAQLLESEGGENLIDVAEAFVEFFQAAEV